jgi:hypothetical protein
VLGQGDAGAVTTELRLNGHKDFFLAALMGTFTTSNTSHDADVSLGLQSIAFSNPVPSATLKGAKVLKISGLPTAGNNGYKRVLKWVGNTAYFLPGSFTVDDALTVSVTVEAFYFRNGANAPDQYCLQDQSIDAGSYQIHQGMCVNELTLELTAKSKAMLTVGFMGYGSFERPDSIFTTIAEPLAENIIECTNHIGALVIDHRTPVASIRALTFRLNNNLRERFVLQRGGTLLPGTGFADFTGTVEAYFTDRKMKRSFLNHADKSLLFQVQNSTLEKFMNFFLPKLKFTEMESGHPGGNSDLMTTFNWQAVKSDDADKLYQCQIDVASGML